MTTSGKRRTHATRALVLLSGIALAAVAQSAPAAADDLGHVVCDKCVGTSDIAKRAITTNRLKPGAVKTNKIADGAVTSVKILDGSVTAADLADEAGVEFSNSEFVFNLTSTDVTVETIVVTSPTSGFVVVFASGNFSLGSTGSDSARCTITQNSTGLAFNHEMAASDIGNTVNFMPFAGTRAFVVSAGSTTFRLVCDEVSGVTAVLFPHLTAIFVPTRY